MTEELKQPPPRSNRIGKFLGIGVILALVIAMTGIGVFHATRNRIRHTPGEYTGHQLYELYCLRCHAPDLRGNRAKEYPSLVEKELQPGEFTLVTREGRNKMPKFAFVDEDVTRLFEYVTAQRGAAPR